MDMKKILQALDGAEKSAPKADDDMKRFVSIVSEGRGPLNRLTQAENIAVTHYSKKEIVETEDAKSSIIDKYFKKVEQELEESQQKKSEKVNQLAERAIKKVSEAGGNYGHPSNFKKHISQSKQPPDSITSLAKSGAKQTLKDDQYTYRDIAELARQGLSDEEIAEKLGFDLNEGLKDPKDNPCWKGYKPVGTKKKGGRTVPNCVPK
jgi:hypothetical protein